MSDSINVSQSELFRFLLENQIQRESSEIRYTEEGGDDPSELSETDDDTPDEDEDDLMMEDDEVTKQNNREFYLKDYSFLCVEFLENNGVDFLEKKELNGILIPILSKSVDKIKFFPLDFLEKRFNTCLDFDRMGHIFFWIFLLSLYVKKYEKSDSPYFYNLLRVYRLLERLFQRILNDDIIVDILINWEQFFDTTDIKFEKFGTKEEYCRSYRKNIIKIMNLTEDCELFS